MTTASPQSGPDILTVGPDQADRLSRRSMFALVAAVMAVIAALVLWRLQPAPAPVFTLPDLQGVYAGMVRSDGTNDASVIDRHHSSEESGYIVPKACEPLFEATVLNRVPHEALDGVGTFWAIDRSAVSLFSYRFRDIASADREYARLTTAFDNCRDARVEVHARPAVTGLLSGRLCPDDRRRHRTRGSRARVQQHRQLAVSLRAGVRSLYTTGSPQGDGLVGGSDARRPGPASIVGPARSDVPAWRSPRRPRPPDNATRRLEKPRRSAHPLDQPQHPRARRTTRGPDAMNDTELPSCVPSGGVGADLARRAAG